MLLRKLTSIKGQLIFLIISIALSFLGITWAYYTFVFHLIQEKEVVYVQNLLYQVVENIQTASDEMIRSARMISNTNDTQQYLTSKLPLERLESANGVFNLIYAMTQDSQGISVAILDTSQKNALVTKPLLSILNSLEQEYNIYSSAENTSGFTGAIHNMYDNLDYYAYYQPILDVRFAAKPKEQIGVCVAVNTITRLEKCISQVETSPHSVFIIMDPNQNIIVSNLSRGNPELEVLAETIRTENVKNSSIQKLNGEEQMVLFQEVPNTKWKVVGVIPLNEIDTDLFPFLKFGTMILVLILIILILWCIQISRSIVIPVVEISSFLQGDAYTTLHHRLHLNNKNEIGMLAEKINQMLDKISALTRTIFQNQSNMYELDLAKKRAELSALQSQINPHFLYNTLDCIKGYGYLLDSNEIIEIVESLSQIMRYCIKGPDIVALEDELYIIQCYMNIISIRFENRIHYSVEIPTETRAIQIPRFILQPLVENAVYHGLEPKYGDGHLRIYCTELSDNDILLCIEDDGIGISEEELSKLTEQLKQLNSDKLLHLNTDNSLALFNINQRIQQSFGVECGLEIESFPGKGTCIKIRLPKNHS